MFAYLTGIVRSKREKYLVVEVNGLGYKVFGPAHVLESSETGSPIELHVHTVVREDDISLYGFREESALELFERLLTVNGVGPKLAMDLFAWPIEKLKTAIANKEIAALTQIHGVGKKTAERIVLELSDKIHTVSTGNNLTEALSPASGETLSNEVLDALMNLGYQKRDIRRILDRQDSTLSAIRDDSEALIRYFLKNV